VRNWKINREAPVLPPVSSITMELTKEEFDAIHHLLTREKQECGLDFPENSLLNMINEIRRGL